jgi:hypothetical protein
VALDPNWNMVSDLGGVDPVIVLQQAIDQGRIYEALEKLKPRYPFYTRLKGALAEYRRIAAAGDGTPSPRAAHSSPGSPTHACPCCDAVSGSRATFPAHPRRIRPPDTTR